METLSFAKKALVLSVCAGMAGAPAWAVGERSDPNAPVESGQAAVVPSPNSESGAPGNNIEQFTGTVMSMDSTDNVIRVKIQDGSVRQFHFSETTKTDGVKITDIKPGDMISIQENPD